jgi:hypothetical protein
MNRKLLFSVLFTLALAACAGRPTATPLPPTETPVPATATEIVPPTPVEVTVLVPVTVIVPQTVVVTTTPEPATPVPPTLEPTATPAVVATSIPAATQALTQPVSAVTLQPVELPAMLTTPQALNGPDPMAGVTGQQFAEYFAPPDYWGTGDDADSTVSIANGQMTIVNKKLQSFVWTFNGIKGKDFYSQVFLTTKLCGFGDNYGLVFRAKDDANLDLFGISCEGRYRLQEISQGKTNTVVDWTDSKYIRKFETTNVIGVRAVGDQISLYVNNYYLATVTASANTEGRFGLYVGNIKTPDLTVYFKALTASRINP